MKRLRSSDDLDSSYSDKASGKDVKDSSNPNPNRASMSSSTSSHRGFYYKSDNVRKGLVSPSSSSRYERDRSLEDDGRVVRKRTDHDFDSFDRRKSGFDRYSSRDSSGGGGSGGMHRSESFSGSRRDFPKGFRSERDRTRREGSISSWRRFGSERKEFGIGSKEFGIERKEFGVGNKEFGSERKEFGGGSKDIGGERKDFEEGGRGSSREERGGKMLREVMKSPSWSRDSGSEQSRVRGVGDSRSKSKSRSRSSPTWSKDSVGSEQSKSLEVAKKNVEVEVEVEVPTEAEVEVKSDGSGSSSSEMEEGELEREVDHDGEHGGAVDDGQGDGIEIKENDVARVDCDDKDENRGQVGEDVAVQESQENVSEGKDNGLKEVDQLPESEKLNVESTGNSEKGSALSKESGKVEVEDLRGDSDCKEKGNKEDAVNEKCVEAEQKEKMAVGFELRRTKMEIVPESNMNQNEVTGGGERNVHTESLNCSIKDKGKGVAVTSTRDADSADNGVWMERDLGVTATWKADEMEGPSTRGFELFTSSPVRKTEEKPEMGVNNKDKELMESLDLSLSLPSVLLPIGARDTNQAPGSPSHDRSVSITNTFRTNSDGFTASMSFSGSQSFFHNPSCSLTQNSLDNLEQSVHSHPVFKGVDWQALAAQNESSRHKEIPLYQRILMNGNGSVHQSQTSLQNSQHVRVAEGSTKMPNGLERQLSFNKQNDVRSPTHSVGSHDIGPSYSFEKRAIREKPGGSGSLYRSGSLKEQEQYPVAGADSVESVLGRIVSDPIQVMARKFNEMSGQSVVRLKDSIRELMLSTDKKGHLSAIQNALHSRSDINMEVLSKAHRTQLLILVALKTGLPEYLQLDSSVSSSDVAEIYLNLRCRNLMCRSPLPVDECECKVCSKNNGFCSACMCLVCSKFDMASNTCSWVGCDVCLHWCHADCGLRESFIRNGNSESGAQGGFTEMQFFCVACDHPSEMFGFVKEVFQNFAKEWSAETMCRELEYVKRIFRGSKDLRGRRLHEIADQMLARLLNKSDIPEVLSYIMAFLTDSESSKLGSNTVFSDKERGKGNNGNASAGPSHDPMWLKSVYSDKAPQLERSVSLLPSIHLDHNHNDKPPPMELDLHKSTQKEPLFDELESIVRIKQAEAKMFQSRADEARRDAENLKRIALAKNEKIEEEFSSRISKLRIVEAEEMRKQKLEEFQALERAYLEYFNMKMRMEADIKDLLLKMDATRRNLAM